ncbi:hypothetical protein DHEL01_v209762 [Diaporthe helianthi]|uniref:Endoglucanase n=1 Tax=Diaporthe helianthi TaxID=158607 RepID=A0A2P5HNL3_DIAHE|nr:hypothetical protein DHEL01_v209762 [Diaporthe helianthi]
MRSTTSATLLAALAGSASAHMMLSYPAPFNSKYNPFANPGTIDYSYTAPLAADGSDYPCKGYQSDLGTPAGQPTATFAAGQQGNITIVGGAAHGGGSCQVSLSTDGAKTFKVIQSIIGNCPVNGEGNFDFTVPSDVPAGDHVLAWSWNNRIGNREFYMNCAAVTITGGSSKRDEATEKRGTSFTAAPDMFVANIGNGCAVAEGGDVEYPNPGDAVISNSDHPEAPSGSCGSSGGSGSGSGSGAAPAPAPAPTPSTVAEITPSLGGIFATVSASVATEASTTLSTVTSAAATPTPEVPAPEAPAPEAPAPEAPAPEAPAPEVPAPSPAPPAAGGSGATTEGSACSNEGEWNCIGGNSYQRCASGTWSAVQSLAAGTSCEAGVAANIKMISARRTGRFHPRRFAA